MANALTWKWQLAQDAALKMLSLEQSVEARVHELLKVSHLLQYDSLTELPNSTLLGDRLSQALAVCRRHDKQLVVMFLGLDRFKRINNALAIRRATKCSGGLPGNCCPVSAVQTRCFATAPMSSW